MKSEVVREDKGKDIRGECGRMGKVNIRTERKGA